MEQKKCYKQPHTCSGFIENQAFCYKHDPDNCLNWPRYTYYLPGQILFMHNAVLAMLCDVKSPWININVKMTVFPPRTNPPRTIPLTCKLHMNTICLFSCQVAFWFWGGGKILPKRWIVGKLRKIFSFKHVPENSQHGLF